MSSTEAYLSAQLTGWANTRPIIPFGYDQYGSPDEIALFRGLTAQGTTLRFNPQDPVEYSAVAFDRTTDVQVEMGRLQGPAIHSMDMVALHENVEVSDGITWHKFFMNFSRRTSNSAPILYGAVTLSGVIHPETSLFVCSPWDRELALSALTFVAARNPRRVYRVSQYGLPLSDA